MVQRCSNRYWWFPGVWEMSQPSWGGGPIGSPPHSRMTTSLQPLMQLHIFDDVSLNCLQNLLVCMYQSDFLSPLLFTGELWVVLIFHVLKYYCISLGCYPKHIMYVGFIIMFLSGPFLCQHVLYSSVPCLLDTLFFVLCYLGGHRYASPASCRTGIHS